MYITQYNYFKLKNLKHIFVGKYRTSNTYRIKEPEHNVIN